MISSNFVCSAFVFLHFSHRLAAVRQFKQACFACFARFSPQKPVMANLLQANKATKTKCFVALFDSSYGLNSQKVGLNE